VRCIFIPDTDSTAQQSEKPAFSLRRFAAETPQKMPLLTELENLFVAGATKIPPLTGPGEFEN
jgi:hypothetical protein